MQKSRPYQQKFSASDFFVSVKYVWSRYAYAQDLDTAVFRALINPKSKIEIPKNVHKAIKMIIKNGIELSGIQTKEKPFIVTPKEMMEIMEKESL